MGVAATDRGAFAMNFKRKGPKKTRSGCLMCKPHKASGNSRGHELGRFHDSRAPLAEDWEDESVRGSILGSFNCACCKDEGCECCVGCCSACCAEASWQSWPLLPEEQSP